MSKIICDICGTTYPESADCCPICGCTQDAASDLLGEDTLAEEVLEETVVKGSAVTPKKKEIFDFDEVNSRRKSDDDDDDDEDEDDLDEEEEEEAPRHNTLVVILLTILIAGLLLAAGFIFIRYFLPNMGGEETTPPTTVQTEALQTTAATEPTVPCEQLTMKNAAVAELDMEGAMFLLNVIPSPENTTDKVIYVSSDESVATVSEDGKVIAVSEGETTIFISCGKISNECKIVVKYPEETAPPTMEAPETQATEAVEETVAATEETVPAATEGSAAVNPDVVLKLKKTDIMLGVYLSFTLELDCELEQNQVQWSSEHPHIAKVDENGMVTAMKSGTTIVTAKYGDQTVECWVRCG